MSGNTHHMTNDFERDHFYSMVGERICATREAQGLTAAELGRRAKLASSTVQNAEVGTSCSLLVLAKLAEALDVTLDDLVPVEATR